MKTKIFFLLLSSFFFGNLVAQQIPTGAPGSNSNNFWSKGGNNGNNGSGNIFGTRWNSPIYFITGGLTQATYRAKLNGTFSNPILQYPVNGYTFSANGVNGINASGYFGLGFNEDFIWSQNAGPGFANGPFSLLHLNGRDGTFVQQGGFRPWMKTGVTFTDNNDLSYVGMRKLGAGTDRTELAVVWSDNAVGGLGPDDMVFRFTGFGIGQGNPVDATSVSNNLQTPWDFDGLHVARFTGLGNFGLGNTFGVNVAGQAVQYATPQSLQHLSLSDLRSVWTQYTNRATNLGSGTGENANDGFRVGILGQLQAARNGNALLYNQENRHILISTGKNTNNVNMNNTQERVRITRIGAPTNNQNGYGVWNPAVLPLDRTRMSISHDPANPVSRPMSLLHLGYNTGSLINQFSTDGWRNWMDVGTFIAQDSDNMYIGLKNEGNDRNDAVISWGDNPTPLLGIGPDYLRIIFTSTQTPPFGSGPGQANDGLEMSRFDPTQDVNNNPNNPNNAGFGKMGVGDFTNNQVTHKIHVRGNGRFEYVPEEETDYVLMAFQEDANNPDDISLRRVHIDSLPTAVIDTAYVNCDSTDLVIVQNGDSLIVDMSCLVDTTGGGIGTGFVPCSDNTGVADLPEDSKVNMNDFDVYFEDGPDSLTQFTGNTIGVGYNCGEAFPGKVSVDNKSEHVGIYVLNEGVTDVGNWPNTVMAGVSSIMRNTTVTGGPSGFIAPAFYGLSENNNPSNLGLIIEARNGGSNTGGGITAGDFINQNNSNTGLRVSAINGTLVNRGIGSVASGAPGSMAQCYGVDGSASGDGVNYGVRGTAIGGGDCYGVYGTSSSSGTGTDDFAGYFDGMVYIMGTTYPSDQNMKTNILDYDSSLFVISQLEPKTFEFTDANFSGMNLPEGHQYGFIAQEVENILPAVVTENTHPAQYDSLGNMVQPEYNFKGLDYEAFIPIVVGGVQEQQGMIEEQDSVISSLSELIEEQDSLITDLNDRLTNLENCLSNILPLLCQINNQMIQQNNDKTQEQLRTLLNVELTDANNIVLDQNVPNPFAEQTVINFSIPETVQKAQIHFYNAGGQLIKTVDVEERGLGSLNVFGADLSTGIYTYTLVADGVIVATKKMQKMNY